jgi:hypothetical protein
VTNSSAIKEVAKYQPITFPPILPSFLGAILDAPTTKVKNISGMTINFRSLRNKSPSGLITQIGGPTIIPKIKPTVICK